MQDEISAGAPAPVSEGASAPPAAEAPAPTIRETMERAARAIPDRADDGKFASRDPEAKAEAAPETEAAPAEPETPDQPETKASETAEEPSIDPPESWSADVKAKWAALPRDLQDFIRKREGEVHRAITQAGERIKSFQAVEQVLAPRRQALAAQFGSEANAVNQLFAISDFAGRDPAGFVQWFAGQHGVDLTALSNAPAGEPSPQRDDPRVNALLQEVTGLKGHLLGQERERTAAAITSFAESKDEKGAPRYPHFEEVREEMSRLIAGRIVGEPDEPFHTTLEKAYAKAIRTNDAVWAKVQAQREAEREAKRKAEAVKAAADAKRAASANVRTTASVSGSPAKGETWQETLRKSFENLQRGAA